MPAVDLVAGVCRWTNWASRLDIRQRPAGVHRQDQRVLSVVHRNAFAAFRVRSPPLPLIPHAFAAVPGITASPVHPSRRWPPWLLLPLSPRSRPLPPPRRVSRRTAVLQVADRGAGPPASRTVSHWSTLPVVADGSPLSSCPAQCPSPLSQDRRRWHAGCLFDVGVERPRTPVAKTVSLFGAVVRLFGPGSSRRPRLNCVVRRVSALSGPASKLFTRLGVVCPLRRFLSPLVALPSESFVRR